MICPCCGKHKRPPNLEALGTALKPAMELIAVARKPLSEKTIAANVLQHGTGAINVDGCRVETDAALGRFNNAKPVEHRVNDSDPDAKPLGRLQQSASYIGKGRWPANVIHDGSEEVVEAFPERDGAVSNGRTGEKGVGDWGMGAVEQRPGYADEGSAARFFYSVKADSDDRLGSKHPTVKPVDLMQWLVRLVTPKNGLVLDPFAGSGTTAEACFREGMRCILIEREEEYQADIRRRMSLCMAGPDERARESIKAKMKDKPVDAGPLFAGSDTPPPPAPGDRFTESSRTNGAHDRADRTEAMNNTTTPPKPAKQEQMI